MKIEKIFCEKITTVEDVQQGDVFETKDGAGPFMLAYPSCDIDELSHDHVLCFNLEECLLETLNSDQEVTIFSVSKLFLEK